METVYCPSAQRRRRSDRTSRAVAEALKAGDASWPRRDQNCVGCLRVTQTFLQADAAETLSNDPRHRYRAPDSPGSVNRRHTGSARCRDGTIHSSTSLRYAQVRILSVYCKG